MKNLTSQIVDLLKSNGIQIFREMNILRSIIELDLNIDSASKTLLSISLIEDIPIKLAKIYSFDNLQTDQRFRSRIKAVKTSLKMKFFLTEENADFILDFWSEIICYNRLFPVIDSDNIRYGYTNFKGELQIDYMYSCANHFNEGLAFVQKGFASEDYYCIDYQGHELFRTQYIDSGIHPVFFEGVAVLINGMCGGIQKGYRFLDIHGDIIVCSNVGSAKRFSEGLAYTELNGKGGFVNHSGELVIPMSYDNIMPNIKFENGMVPIQKNNRFGMIDKNNKAIIPFMYDFVTPYSDGLTSVRMNDKYQYHDISGNVVIPHISGCDFAGKFSEGLAPVSILGKTGFINNHGDFEITPRYCFDYPNFLGGVAFVWMKIDDYIAKYVDKQGNAVSGVLGHMNC